MKPKRQLVPTGVRNLLRRVQASEDQELVYERGAGWWVGCDQVAGRYARLAIQLVLVGLDGFSRVGHGMERYHVNEEGRRALGDPAYVPTIVKHLRASRRTR